MKRFLALFASVLMATGCGSQDYAKAPPPTGFSDTTQPPMLPSDYTMQVTDRVVNNNAPSTKGHLWKALEWYGMDDKAMRDLRCRFRDDDGVRAFDAFGVALLSGAVIGVLVRASGSVFFGHPSEDYSHNGPGGHGPSGHDGHMSPQEEAERSVWNHLHLAFKHAGVAALHGAIFVGGCQTLLAGGNFTPFNGLLGSDFAGLSAALAVGSASALAVPPWVHRFFGDPPPPEKPNMDTSHLHPENDINMPPPGRIQRILNWSEKSGFRKGMWYHVMPGLSVLFISSSVGVLVYNRLHEQKDRSAARRQCEALSVNENPIL